MTYNFVKHNWDGTIVFGIETKSLVIRNFGSWGWTPTKIQTIIDGIEDSKTRPKGKEYYWGNEDMDLYANKNGVLLIDEISQRAGEHDPDNITLRLTHQEILKFLHDFKAFVEANQ